VRFIKNQEYEQYKNATVDICDNHSESRAFNGLGELNVGFLELDFTKNTLYINEFLLLLLDLGISTDLTFEKLFINVLEKEEYDVFVEYISSSRKSNKVEHFLLSLQNGMSFNVKMRCNDITNRLIILFEQNYLCEKNSLSDLLDNVPLPIFCMDYKQTIRYSNQPYTAKFIMLHSIIEKLISNQDIKLELYDYIQKFDLFKVTEDSHIYNVWYDDIEISITRKIVEIQDEKCMMYVHQSTLIDKTEEDRLKKILKVNELIIEIKDIVDTVSEVHEMFDYLLPQIHTVIPFAKRSCILRIDENENMFMDSKFNYPEEYVTEFLIPFKNSYAYLHLVEDYSKSVIIDDVQQRYSNLFPDLKEKALGLSIESNITTPLVVQGVLYGIVSIDSDENRVFDDVDLNLMDFLKVQIERTVEKHDKFEIIKRNSNIDPMTGISNRRHLKLEFSDLVKNVKTENKPFLFVVFDLDKLKYINDTYGHISGDETIKQFAFVIQKHIRETDFFARIGGDEFVGIFLNVEEHILVQRINTWTTYFNEHPNMYLNKPITTLFSYGISKSPSEGKTFDELLEVADKRMYVQKRNKTN
jgi:diguanylate cyclase (GGDEF)-like protein